MTDMSNVNGKLHNIEYSNTTVQKEIFVGIGIIQKNTTHQFFSISYKLKLEKVKKNKKIYSVQKWQYTDELCDTVWILHLNKVMGNHYLRDVHHSFTLHCERENRIFDIHLRLDI